MVKNLTSTTIKKQSIAKSNHQGFEHLKKSLLNCDFFDGNWVRDKSYPLYKPNSCSLIDEQFNCFFNGSPDSDYYKLKWKPKACTLPRYSRLFAPYLNIILKVVCLIHNPISDDASLW